MYALPGDRITAASARPAEFRVFILAYYFVPAREDTYEHESCPVAAPEYEHRPVAVSFESGLTHEPHVSTSRLDARVNLSANSITQWSLLESRANLGRLV